MGNAHTARPQHPIHLRSGTTAPAPHVSGRRGVQPEQQSQHQSEQQSEHQNGHQPVIASPPVGAYMATLNVDPLGAAATGMTVTALPPAGIVVAM